MGGSLLSHGGSPSHYGFKTKSWLFMTWIWGTTMTSERSIFRGTTLWKKDVLRGSIDDGNSEEVCNCLEILQVWACEVQILMHSWNAPLRLMELRAVVRNLHLWWGMVGI